MDMLRDKRQWDHIKHSTEAREGRKRVGDKGKKKGNKEKTVKNIASINLIISVITLMMTCLNTPIKRQKLPYNMFMYS